MINNNKAFILQYEIAFMCIKCELLNIINKESELKMEKTLLSKENYLTTDLLSESTKIKLNVIISNSLGAWGLLPISVL